ncbi:MAG: glycine cleavage T C-terminal barrel domain-containing protein, partial [Alphaproteobacteria bacterium]
PVLARTVALARVAVDHARIGAALEIGKLDGQQKRLPAVVARVPFYDPDKRRARE